MTERNTANVELNHDQLLELVQKAMPSCHRINDWRLLTGGAQNTLYKLTIGSESFVLRLYTRDRSHCSTEQALFKLIGSVVPVPELIYADETHEPWAYALFRFVPGVHIDKVAPESGKQLSHTVGKTHALIHSFKFSQAGIFASCSTLPPLTGRPSSLRPTVATADRSTGSGGAVTFAIPFPVGSSPYFEEAHRVLSQPGHARQRLGEQRADEILAFMEQNKDFFPIITNDNICLVHADFKPVNLLYTPQETVCVLDWEFAHAGVGIMDFAILLRHRDQFPLDLDALKNGYETNGGILPNEWFKSALITDFVNIMHLLNSPTERPKLFAQLEKAIATTMDQ